MIDMEYQIISYCSLADLGLRVTQHLADGWELHGPLTVGPEVVTEALVNGRIVRNSSVEYSQAVVRRKDD